jgi:hypothetical protein
LLVYGVLYVVMEMVGQQLAVVGWPQVTALDIATALTDAFLVLAIGAAVVLSVHLGIRWWLRRRAERPIDVPLQAEWDDEPIEVTAWRPTAEEMASPPPRPPPAKGTYGGNPYSFAGRRWPTDDGRQL